ncbi:hypothetical protein PENTCL1PPCAC_15630, partial [Pristionchus entomophagus]
LVDAHDCLIVMPPLHRKTKTTCVSSSSALLQSPQVFAEFGRIGSVCTRFRNHCSPGIDWCSIGMHTCSSWCTPAYK